MARKKKVPEKKKERVKIPCERLKVVARTSASIHDIDDYGRTYARKVRVGHEYVVVKRNAEIYVKSGKLALLDTADAETAIQTKEEAARVVEQRRLRTRECMEKAGILRKANVAKADSHKKGKKAKEKAADKRGEEQKAADAKEQESRIAAAKKAAEERDAKAAETKKVEVGDESGSPVETAGS